ncbi:hypothetical protein AKJ09_07362 [Labilithrix luteola]|uniref:Uncharacterized protein n=1 Tax=Labilithrix luteola TaxID=1391654 RepID=A0A0K1Q4N1_9BACT|nr:hypothetical protein AKJ09_07362 [Labilithrix luteola]
MAQAVASSQRGHSRCSASGFGSTILRRKKRRLRPPRAIRFG